MSNRRIILASYPQGLPVETDFAIVDAPVPEVNEGQFLIRNMYFSLDAGFRQWMREGAGDNYLSAMPLNAPVMSITLGRVEKSRHPDYPEGTFVTGRHTWETYTLTDGSDFTLPLIPEPNIPLHYYLGTLGPTGLTAYLGVMDIGRPKHGETIVVSAAAGAVGTVAGQIAKALGCRTVGFTSSDDKARWLEEEVGYDIGLNYNSKDGLDALLHHACPDGIDIYFDNVGGEILNAVMGNMSEGARIILCGMVSRYHDDQPPPGPSNIWEAITKRATLKGFMYSDHADRYGEGLARMKAWMASGQLKSFDDIVHGIEATPAAFCGMFRGRNRGKIIIKL